MSSPGGKREGRKHFNYLPAARLELWLPSSALAYEPPQFAHRSEGQTQSKATPSDLPKHQLHYISSQYQIRAASSSNAIVGRSRRSPRSLDRLSVVIFLYFPRWIEIGVSSKTMECKKKEKNESVIEQGQQQLLPALSALFPQLMW